MNIEDKKLISFEFGKDAVDAIFRHINLFGDEFVDVDRVLATTRKIRHLDRSDGLECICEALFYEPFYYDGFQDLKNCIKKGGIDLNRKNIERMLYVGIELPTEIKGML